jgi:hypothetical protein
MNLSSSMKVIFTALFSLAALSQLVGCDDLQKSSYKKAESKQNGLTEVRENRANELLWGYWTDTSNGDVVYLRQDINPANQKIDFYFQSPALINKIDPKYPPMTRLFVETTLGQPFVARNIKGTALFTITVVNGSTLELNSSPIRDSGSKPFSVQVKKIDRIPGQEIYRTQSNRESLRWLRLQAQANDPFCSIKDPLKDMNKVIRTHNLACANELIKRVQPGPQFKTLRDRWYLLAVAELDLELAQLFITNGALPDSYNETGENALQSLMRVRQRQNNPDSQLIWLDPRPLTEYLIELGVDFNEPDAEGFSPFQSLVFFEGLDVGKIIYSMIQKGARFEVRRARGTSVYESFFTAFQEKLGPQRHYILEALLESVSTQLLESRSSLEKFLRAAALFADPASFDILQKKGFLTNNNLNSMINLLRASIESEQFQIDSSSGTLTQEAIDKKQSFINSLTINLRHLSKL